MTPDSVVPRSVQVPENRTRSQKSHRTGPKPARKAESVLELEPEPEKAIKGPLPPSKLKILFVGVSGKNCSLTEKISDNLDYISLLPKMLAIVIFFCTYIKESTLNSRILTDTIVKNWNLKQNSYKNGPRPGRKSESVLDRKRNRQKN